MRFVFTVLLSIFTFTLSAQNYAAVFNGTTSYIQVPDNNAIDLSGTFTIEAWIFPTAAGSDATQGGIIVNKENSYEVARFANGTIQFGFSANGAGTDWSWVNSSLTAPLNQWSHVAVVKSGANVTVYLNGASTFTNAAQPATLAANTQNLRIGGRSGGSQFFAGSIDDVRIWNTARTITDIKTYLFDQNLAANATGLVGYYKMLEGSGTTAANFSSNVSGINGTLSNTSWAVSPIQFARNGLSFDGTDDLVTTQLSISGMTAFTLEGWIYPRAGGNRIGFFGQNDAIEFGFSSANTINAWTANGSSLSWTFDNTNFPFDTWHHVAFVGNGTTLTLYTDGVQRAIGGSATANYGTSADRFNIGGSVWDNTGNNFNGIIDEVKIWNVARTQTQIQNSMFTYMDPVTATGLLGFYSFNQGINTGANSGLLTVPDRKGSNNGTLTNFNLSSGNTTSNFVLQNTAVLPLRWLSFTATLADTDVHLEWSTADEKNTKDFIVQHSTNGIDWVSVGNVNTKGDDGASVNTYSFVHDNVAQGVNYYRLLQRDVDDAVTYSVIKSVKVTDVERSFVVLNNPVVAGAIYLQVNKPTELFLYNNQGQLLQKRKYAQGNHKIDLSGHASGLYIIRTDKDNVRIVKR